MNTIRFGRNYDFSNAYFKNNLEYFKTTMIKTRRLRTDVHGTVFRHRSTGQEVPILLQPFEKVFVSGRGYHLIPDEMIHWLNNPAFPKLNILLYNVKDINDPKDLADTYYSQYLNSRINFNHRNKELYQERLQIYSHLCELCGVPMNNFKDMDVWSILA